MTDRFGLDAGEHALLAQAEAIARQVGRPTGAPLSRGALLAAFAALAPTGYLSSILPGSPCTPLGFAALCEGLSPTLPLLGNQSVQRYLHAFGSDEQKHTLLPDLLAGRTIAGIAITEPNAGGDLDRIATTAVRSGTGHVINGRKTWVTHGMVADHFVVLAATPEGPTRFMVPATTPGLIRTPLEPTGLRHLTFAELAFVDCALPAGSILGAPGQGNAGAKTAFPIARALAALQAIRLGEAALRLAADFARARTVFNRPLATSAVVRDNIVAFDTALAAARLLAYRCMLTLDAPSAVAVSSAVKAMACDSALQACRWTLDLLGSASLRQSHEGLTLAEDARMMAVVDGTVLLNRLVAARRMLAAPPDV